MATQSFRSTTTDRPLVSLCFQHDATFIGSGLEGIMLKCLQYKGRRVSLVHDFFGEEFALSIVILIPGTIVADHMELTLRYKIKKMMHLTIQGSQYSDCLSQLLVHILYIVSIGTVVYHLMYQITFAILLVHIYCN